MKAALIAPKGYEHTVLQSDIHLILPFKDTLSNPNYLRTYMDAKDRGDYIILDNGCAEGDLVTNQALAEAAHVFQPDEVVAPDVMGSYTGTRALTHEFLREFEGDYKIMAVLQGEYWIDLEALLAYYVTEARITTIGIPKVLVKNRGDTMRVRIARHIAATYPDRFDIHLLGASPHFTDELDLLSFSSGIRSTDSALPYKFTYAKQELGFDKAHVKRWPGYFKEEVNLDPELLESNVRTYMRWAARHK